LVVALTNFLNGVFMRKNLLSLSIAAMIGGLGLAGSASAGVSIVTPTSTATLLAPSTSGVGNILVVPYFSTQNGNSTLLSIVNSDTVNGKAVKVRFRGAANSDDVYDFQVFLSPSDVWTANVSQNSAGLSMLTTADTSCTLPSASTLNSTPFVTNRLPAVSSTFTAAQQASWTREGYVEIFNMADIPPNSATTSLFTAIRHVNGVPPGCPNQVSSSAAFTPLQNDVTAATYASVGFAAPTSGLFGGATIINTAGASVAWSGNDYALVAVNNTALAPAPGNIVFSPQMPTNAATPSLFTNDPLMIGAAPIIVAANYDLPDLSTPYVGTITPTAQANATASGFATLAVNNEYLVTPSIAAATDWTFTMPTRRYAVAMNYAAATPAAVYSSTNNGGLASWYFTSANVSVSTANKLLLCVASGSQTAFGQEEQTAAGSSFVVSPGQVAPGINFCGEASVLSFSGTSVLGATVAQSGVAAGLPSGVTAGWLNITTPGIGNGLPILGASYEQATGPVVAGKSTNFGISYQHRYQRGSVTALPF